MNLTDCCIPKKLSRPFLANVWASYVLFSDQFMIVQKKEFMNEMAAKTY